MLQINEKIIDELNNKNSSDNDIAILYVQNLDSKNLPALLSFEHLSKILEINPDALAAMCCSQHDFYNTFYIPKRSGGLRKIDAPLPSMYSAQKFILDNIIKNLSYCSKSSTAYIKDSSIKEHVLKHLNQNFLFKLDIKNFFPSITVSKIFGLLEEVGYKKDVANILANLLTLMGTLPQGAPISPHLSNIVSYKMDIDLREYCDRNNLIYSRYADDLVISGFSFNEENKKIIESIVQECGFEINIKKLKLYSPEEPIRRLTGLILNKDKVRIPKNTRRKIRQMYFYVEKYLLIDLGLIQNHRSLKKEFNLTDPIILERLVGYLNFWIWIEPDSIYAKNTLQAINDYKFSFSALASGSK